MSNVQLPTEYYPVQRWHYVYMDWFRFITLASGLIHSERREVEFKGPNAAIALCKDYP